jgi:hypothetical protein
MSKYISSVSVTLCPRDSSLGLKSFVICLDHNSGCTLSHAVHFVVNSPLVKAEFSKYFVSNLNFKYSEL